MSIKILCAAAVAGFGVFVILLMVIMVFQPIFAPAITFSEAANVVMRYIGTATVICGTSYGVLKLFKETEKENKNGSQS